MTNKNKIGDEEAQYGQVDTVPSSFDISADKLQDMFDNSEREPQEKLADLGGVNAVLSLLKSDAHNGIQDASDDAIDERFRVFGVNIFERPPPASLLALLLDALKDPILILLLICAVVTLVLSMALAEEDELSHAWTEAFAIFVAVFAASGVTALQDWQKDKQFQALNAVKDDRRVRVMRNGQTVEVSITKLVAGDLVILGSGDFVPADGLFTSGHELKCDESSMTGEADMCAKDEHAPFMISGCKVVEGQGTFVVTCVGPRSRWGVLMAHLQEESPPTPLQEKLERLATLIGYIGGVAALLTFFALLIRELAEGECTTGDDCSEIASNILDALVIAITIIVVAVPEGLPLAVTISLAYSMKKMVKDNNLVRKLEACETMGGATCICSDKTGTLTENKMTVIRCWIAGEYHTEVPAPGKIPKTIERLFLDGAAINSTASPSVEDGRTVYLGNPTEGAILAFGKKINQDYDCMKIRGASDQVKVIPFSSARKRMSAIVNDNNELRMYTKGASEMVLSLCTNLTEGDGSVKPLDESTRSDILGKIEDMAGQGLRTIAFATKVVPASVDYEHADGDELESELTLIGVTGIADPPRKEVPDAVKTCQSAGIVVRMVTGDNILTAKTIAKQCHILTEGGIALEGPKFRNMSDEELDAILPKLQVLARSSPSDKHKLVTHLRNLGHVVAVTGDGTNDAPALKAADVGLAMNLTGTEVAREAADMVIMDDNFSSIVKAVMWGRNVYDSIRKFLQFQLSVNVVALVTNFISAVSGNGAPLNTVQLLWVNLIMDTMAALALATESPTPDLLRRRPYKRDSSLITKRMWRNIFVQSAYQVIVLCVLLYAGDDLLEFTDRYTNEEALAASAVPGSEQFSNLTDPCQDGKEACERNTLIFNVFVFLQIFNEINCRKLKDELNVFQGIGTNVIFIGVLIITVVVQVILVQWGGENGLKTTGLPLFEHWVVSIAASAMCMPLCTISKVLTMKMSWFDEPEDATSGVDDTNKPKAEPEGSEEA